MFSDLWKIDPSQGESRFAQLIGILLLICMIAFFIWQFESANHNKALLISANQSFSDNSDAELGSGNFKKAKVALRHIEIKNK